MKSLVTAVLLTLASSSAFAEAPSIWNGWQETKLDAEQCLQRAEFALKQAGFTSDSAVTQTSVFGTNGQYRATIRCATEKEFVLFVVSGATSETAKHFLGTIRANF